MITDDLSIAAKFESATFGALVRVLSISAGTFAVDLAAGRVFHPHEGLTLTAHMDLGSVRFPPQRDEELRQWPMDRNSIFNVVQEKHLTDAAFRPRQALDAASLARTDQFRPMEPYARVVDAFCITTPLLSPAWAMLVFMRCAPHRPFDDAQTAQILRAKPAIVRVLREGYQRDVHRIAGETVRAQMPTVEARTAIPHTPQTLSQTEQQIVAMLVVGMTEKQIAEKMGRSPHTTHVHVRNIYRKTSVTSRRELKQYFAETLETRQ